MKLRHLSKDISTLDKEFTPRIPKNTLEDEDSTTPRICMSDTIENCINAFPYKANTAKDLLIRGQSFLCLYELDTNNYLSPEDISSKVGDSLSTREHWILYSFTSKPVLLRITQLNLAYFNKWLRRPMGRVKELQFEKSIENYDRIIEDYILGTNLYKKLKKVMNNNCKIIDTQCFCGRLRHPSGDLSSKSYKVYKVKYFIPAGANATDIWLTLNNSDKLTIRKNFFKCSFSAHFKNSKDDGGLALVNETIKLNYKHII